MYNFLKLDVPFNKQIGFQDPATPIMEGIIDLHHYIFFFLVIIIIFVVWLLFRILWLFVPRKTFYRNVFYLDFLEKIFTLVGIYDFCFFIFLKRKEVNFLNKFQNESLFLLNNIKLYYYAVCFSLFWSKNVIFSKNCNIKKMNRSFIKDVIRSSQSLIAFLNYISLCELNVFNRKKKKIETLILSKFLKNEQLNELNSTIKVKKITNEGITDCNTLTGLQLTHGTGIEIFWTIMPSFILLLIALPSFALLYSIDEVINPVITLKVIGHQWYWSYEYSDYFIKNSNSSLSFDSYLIPEEDLQEGQVRLLEVDNRVILPVNTPIRVLVTSGDVLHSWAIPSLGVKIDAVPGRLNQVYFILKRKGLFYGQCSEICGVNHGFMPIAVESVSLSDYCNWISNKYKE